MKKTRALQKLALVTGALTATIALSGCSVLNSLMPSSKPVRDSETGEIAESQDNADVFSIRAGDCLNSSSLGTEVSAVPVVPCADSHEDEIYFVFDLPEGDFPGDFEVGELADETCTAEFNNFVGKAWEESQLDWWPFTPTADSWSGGDREILCAVYDPAGKVTGTLAGSAR